MLTMAFFLYSLFYFRSTCLALHSFPNNLMTTSVRALFSCSPRFLLLSMLLSFAHLCYLFYSASLLRFFFFSSFSYLEASQKHSHYITQRMRRIGISKYHLSHCARQNIIRNQLF